MKKEHFVTHKIRAGEFSWTLTSYLGRFLSDIESMFGPRDTSFTILGIELVETDGDPQNWLPRTSNDYKHVIIQLSKNAIDNEKTARWELAHECVHLLDPRNITLSGPTNVLEEGIATWYQNHKEGRKSTAADPRYAEYAEAEKLILPLVEVLPDAIRRIRQKEDVPIGDIKKDVLREYCPEVSPELAQRLTQQFKR